VAALGRLDRARDIRPINLAGVDLTKADLPGADQLSIPIALARSEHGVPKAHP
jgi:hypothetical protein